MMPEQRRVLIVDDNEHARTFAASVLARAGYAVTEAGDPALAVEALEGKPFSAIILDLKMPHDGVSMLDYIGENLPDLLPRTIILTAPVNRTVWGALTKPFQPEPLLAAVKDCCARVPS
jgi:CheY-like chemotaxis protein